MKRTDFIAKLYDWFKGDINRDGERQMEAFAREDSFAQEGLEGYRSFPEGNHEAAIQRVKQKLDGSSRKKSGFYWMKIAASLLLIIGAGAIFWKMNSPKVEQKDAGIAALEPAREIEKAVSGEPKEITNVPTSDLIEAKKSAPKISSRPTRPKKRQKLLPPPASSKKEKVEIIDRPAVLDEIVKNVSEGIPGSKDEEPIKEVPPTRTDSILSDDKIIAPTMVLIDGVPLDVDAVLDTNKFFKGIVKTQDGHPVTGARISGRGVNVTTFTNVNGQFVMKYSPDLKQLLLEADDYESLSIPITGPDNVTLHLANNEDDFSSNKDKFSRKKQRSGGRNSALPPVRPKEGYMGFGKTITQAIRYPEKALLEGVEGNVELTFIILKDGSISNIRVLESPSDLLSAEAIRIFQSLPKWMNGTGKSQVLTYSVPFKIGK